jgi:hypothetical protein
MTPLTAQQLRVMADAELMPVIERLKARGVLVVATLRGMEAGSSDCIVAATPGLQQKGAAALLHATARSLDVDENLEVKKPPPS